MILFGVSIRFEVVIVLLSFFACTFRAGVQDILLFIRTSTDVSFLMHFFVLVALCLSIRIGAIDYLCVILRVLEGIYLAIECVPD
ncbi:hypothetical protein HK407_08g12490 [Ordospora pajunii]|uniref:uncharacterized protein n=1 Tax=Ordospora pajunii TaxID=3039483 RepID=UPI002952724C|nr:uncharacterized protein HK407_08g12490 [Ordospora pajunii]KAH9411105.1 hypothetical protein HK407_08g12490 [Ordospora pajunii]